MLRNVVQTWKTHYLGICKKKCGIIFYINLFINNFQQTPKKFFK